MQLSVAPTKVKEMVLSGFEKIRAANSDLQEAYETYVAQYGKDKITVSDPFNLAEIIDPAVLILGRNCTIFLRRLLKVVERPSWKRQLETGRSVHHREKTASGFKTCSLELTRCS